MDYIASRLGDEGRNTPRATISPTTRDIAWAAGIFEGEGTCAKTGKRGTMVQIKQKDRWLCPQLQKFFGGTVKPRAYIRRGYGKDRLIKLWYWDIHGPRARGFLMTIYKFLSPRRQAQIHKALGIF